MRLGQTSAVVSIARFASSIIGFLATIIFANILGAETLGIYFLIMSLLGWTQLLGLAGVQEALSKRLSEGKELGEFFSAGAIVTIVLYLIILSIILIVPSHIIQYVGSDQAPLFLVVMLTAIVPFRFIGTVLKGRHLVHVGSLLSLGRSITASTLQVIIILYGFGLSGLIFGSAVATAGFALIGIAFVAIRTDVSIAGCSLKKHFRSIFSYGKYSWINGLKGRTFNQLDIIVLGFFVNPGLIGIYVVCWNIASFLQIFGQSIRSAIFPEISSLSSSNETEEIADLVANSLAFTGLIIIPGFIGGFIIDERLLRFYGSEFTKGVAVFSLLILATAIYEYKSLFTTALNAVNRPDLAFRSNIVLIGSNALLNISLIYFYGWVGAAVATLISAALGLIISYILLRSVLKIPLPYSELLRQLLSAGIMGIIVKLALVILTTLEVIQSNYVIVGLLVSIGATTYLSTLYILSPMFRLAISDNLPRLKFQF